MIQKSFNRHRRTGHLEVLKVEQASEVARRMMRLPVLLGAVSPTDVAKHVPLETGVEEDVH
jgi:hypothetical protein